MALHISDDESSISEINVTPMVDVMLVLLIIFMVTAPMLKMGTDVHLPQSRNSDVAASERLVVTIDAKERFFLNGQEIAADRISGALQEALAAAKRPVYLEADGTLPYQQVIAIMDTLKDAGAETVGLVTRPAARKKEP